MSISSSVSFSYVNFIVGWRVSIFEMYDSSSSLVPVHMMNISSMNLSRCVYVCLVAFLLVYP